MIDYIDYTAEFKAALKLLHRNVTDTDKNYLLRRAMLAIKAAKESGQRATRVKWSCHPQPRVGGGR
ncbi:hypothetical protein [Nitratifractor salsuginis]|uniref:Uncharacterized protein n=1 Tax=Nitratifractor salsuginis (strain DSM 16511 / JCM 12458 / E9I37-1) TaxID=749222 RepID=E6X1S2_NITSE|nr:hypothetical protein [Nitratifractor salsuginis]ADV47063.1 hypothetical protein Nitsa_1818 [Nitratifractor salsuginis DSM 16511]